eukprot:Nitzschia sp. Nitz4//scaffold181_size46380//20200//21799//NITZ4_007175-RA/size46380-augustus-gene-0.43-mRNA-1//1//CDS//3329539504//6301//frame0
MNDNNNNNNNNDNDHLQAIAAFLSQQRQASLVTESQGNTTSSDQRSGDSNSRSDSSSSSNRLHQQGRHGAPAGRQLPQQSIQPLVDAAPTSQATNLLAGLDFATQALLLKALQNQQAAGQPVTGGVGQQQQGGTSALSAQEQLIRLLQGIQPPKQQQTPQQHAPAAVAHSQATPQVGTGTTTSYERSDLPVVPDRTSVAAPLQSTIPRHTIVALPSASEHQAASGNATSSLSHSAGSSENERDKKDNKRAAVCISAKESRLRKKQYVESLERQNTELRKLRQIVAVVPDVILSFDSSGVIRFVTKSAKDILGVPSAQLQGTSFWELLCTKDVQRLKAAFMDSLENRGDPDVESVSLGGGVWYIHMKDQDPKGPGLSLHGSIRFNGTVPECVCLVRRMYAPSSSTTIPNEVGSDDRQSETTSDQTSSDDAAVAPRHSGSSEEEGDTASPEAKLPSVVQAADYNGQDKNDTSSSMSSGSS